MPHALPGSARQCLDRCLADLRPVGHQGEDGPAGHREDEGRGRGRDEEAWSQLVAWLTPRIRTAVRTSFRRRRGRVDPWWVEELTQEVFRLLVDDSCRRLRRFRGRSEGELCNWVVLLARRLVRDRLESRQGRWMPGSRVRRRMSLREALAESPVTLLTEAPDPERSAMVRQRWQRLLGRCRSLVGREGFRLVRWALLEGHGSREVARRLGGGVTPSAVDNRVRRLRRRLEAGGVRLTDRRRA